MSVLSFRKWEVILEDASQFQEVGGILEDASFVASPNLQAQQTPGGLDVPNQLRIIFSQNVVITYFQRQT